MSITHAELVKALTKPGQDILATLTPRKVDLWHHASAAHGEAGELFDAVKKFVVYNKPLDLQNIVEELGDLEFYLEGIRQNLGITREDTIAQNITKLSKRYEGLAYSDKAAQERADKKEETQVITPFKVGDRVRIAKRVNWGSGWDDIWTNVMDKTVGASGEIRSLKHGGYFVRLDSQVHGSWNYPAEALELIA